MAALPKNDDDTATTIPDCCLDGKRGKDMGQQGKQQKDAEPFYFNVFDSLDDDAVERLGFFRYGGTRRICTRELRLFLRRQNNPTRAHEILKGTCLDVARRAMERYCAFVHEQGGERWPGFTESEILAAGDADCRPPSVPTLAAIELADWQEIRRFVEGKISSRGTGRCIKVDICFLRLVLSSLPPLLPLPPSLSLSLSSLFSFQY